MKTFRFYPFVIGFVVSSGVFLPAPFATDEATASSESQIDIQNQLDDLKQKILILERKLEIEKEAAVEKEKKTPILGADSKGFFAKSPQGDFNLRLRGGVQVDSRFFLGDGDELGNDTFTLRRVRPSIEGTLFEKYDIKIMPDFAGGETKLMDAYLNAKFADEVQLRAGKMKSPMGLERLQSWYYLNFIERGFPTQLLPNRDIGVQLHGDLFAGTFSYAVGAFNGVPDGASTDFDDADGKDLVGRLFSHPFLHSDIDPLKGFGIGISCSYGDYDNKLASYKTPGQATFFSYASNVKADGEQYRFSPQGYYYWGPFGLLGEYAYSSQEVRQGSSNYDIQNDSWQIYLTYVLTGEDASYKGVKPSKPFNINEGTWGAFEIAGRYGNLDIDDAVFDFGLADPSKSASEADEFTAGLNWYLNSNLKVNLNYSHTEFSGGGTAGDDREDEDLIATRFQLTF